ncbi:MAG TPA: class I SAM-dependent methyltransferase [Bryobacteraceae bacterium]|nr:class I SAM-dependent methyltransferase [Bryobacteraceae bacterium]
MATNPMTIEQQTGALYGQLWPQYDDPLFLESVSLFEKRWRANGEPADFFQGKKCLDVGCGGGRYSIAMSALGAASVTGVDVSEEGVRDAARRAEQLERTNVTFRRASALDLPFADSEFDFVCCSGVLHHTTSISRGMAEVYRVLKPGGSLYLLLYGAGGLFWPSTCVMRAFAKLLGRSEMERCVQEGGYPANRRRAILDDLFVPVLETYPPERIEQLLRDTGFREWRRWTEGRMDHENDARTMLAELEGRLLMWEAGARSAPDYHVASIERHAAEISRKVIASVRDLIAMEQKGLITADELRDTVIGHGHHRLIAIK